MCRQSDAESISMTEIEGAVMLRVLDNTYV